MPGRAMAAPDGRRRVAAGRAMAVAVAVAVAAVVVVAVGAGNLACRGDREKAAPASWAATVALDEQRFAGFSLPLPAGELMRRSGAADVGVHELADPAGRPGLLTVTWEPGGARTMAELVEVRDAIAEAAGRVVVEEKTEDQGVARLFSLVELTAGHHLAVSLLQCPASGLTISLSSNIAGTRADNEGLHRRVTAGLECLAGEGAEAARPSFPAFDPPPGFGHLRGSEPPTFLGVDETFFSFERSPIDPASDLDTRKSRFAAEAAKDGMEIRYMDPYATVHAGRSGTPMSVLMLTLAPADGERVNLFLGEFDCRALGVTFLVQYLASAQLPREAGVAHLIQAGCPGAEPVDPASFPSVPTVFTRACDDGDGRACKLLGDLVGDGEVQVPGREPAALYREACRLGYRAACP